MIGLRPKTTALYLERPRLLSRFPDSAGYVVWLEAAYGYGKSVLTSQWAAQLEGDGWRVIWLSLMGEEARGLTGRALELPENAPWSIVLERLWAQPTLIILEDLEGTEKLTPILKNTQGLVLLSSRKRLPEPELPRLKAEGRLIHLTARELAFTLDEARTLFANDAARAQRAWEHSQGWSLPLHLAALTGTELKSTETAVGRNGPKHDALEHDALLEGMRESLEPVVWDEALLLATLNHLPLTHATEHTRALSQAGFAQALETGYRLHPLAAETALEHYGDDARRVVTREAARLPVTLRAEAFERLSLWHALAELLEQPTDLARQNPAGVTRWDEMIRASGSPSNPGGPQRSLQVGEALCLLGRKPEGVERLLSVTTHPQATPAHRLAAYREALWHMADVDLERARGFAAAGEALLDQVENNDAVKFIHYTTRLDFMTNDFARAEAGIQRALELVPKDAPQLRRLSLLTNLAVMRWYRIGDLEGQQRLLEETLTWEGIPALQAGIMHWNLGMNYHLFSMDAQALEQFRQTQRFELVRPVQALQARAMELILERHLSELGAVMARLALWEQPGIEDRLHAAWAMVLLADGQAEAALEQCQAQTPYCRIARAQVQQALGNANEALETLRPLENDLEDRDLELHWVAAHYRVTREPASLERFLKLTTSGARLLPHFVPFSELPRNQPELSDAYPLQTVLRSGWKEAVKRRHPEIPSLEIRVLGGFEARVLNEPVTLTQRPREIMLLSLLGQSREAITEAIWPDLEPEKMRNNLHFNLNTLRKVLEPWGVPTYLFEHGLERVHSDLHDLEAALARGEAEAVSALYTGDLAPGVDLTTVDEAREDLRSRVIECLYGAATRPDLTPDRALALFERTLEIDPLHEDALRALLEVLIRLGRRKSAERRYQAFSRRLRDETGLEPATDTRRVLS